MMSLPQPARLAPRAMSSTPSSLPPDARRHSPAAERNRGPILEVLRRVLPATGRALEVASGSGQHAAFFAAALPGWTWIPSDPDPQAAPSIAAWCAEAGLANVRPALQLDVHRAPPWPGVPLGLDAVYCANMLHIAPASAGPALLRGAAAHLAPSGRLLLYGPFLEQGVPTAAGNQAFDADLRARDPAWGLRWLHELLASAAACGLVLQERVAMPANNLLLVIAPGSASAPAVRA